MESYPPIKVYGVSNLEVLNFLRKEIFKDFRRVVVVYTTLVPLVIGGIVGVDKIDQYCSTNKCEANIGALHISYEPSKPQNKTLDLLAE